MPLLHRPFARVGVINRGEAAQRFLRAARAWSKRRGLPLEVVAFYTDPDRNALFVREADHAVALGPALVRTPDGATQSAYLDIPRIVAALQAARCDAAWPGWGFLAERPDFAEACTEAGIVFLGPSPETMRRLGDKIAARRIAETQGVPVTDWSDGAVATAEAALEAAKRIGFPVVIKASAGGGGRGIRLVHEAHSLPGAFASAAQEARSAFGDPTLFVESLMPEARHVEVQIVADRHGHTLALGTRDCSLQRRHQKVLEEAPAPGLGALEAQLCEAAVSVARACGYTNAGTVEFLVRPDVSGFAFLEINTRLQVEHPVTESITGLDLVGLQIDIARGDSLPAAPPRRGHAIEARLNAEDPTAGFRPSVGRLVRFDLPAGPGIRVDTGFAPGDVVPSEFDSMLAKIIAVGDTREEALARLEDALDRTVVALEGGPSNRCLLRALCAHPAFLAGPVTTRWLDRLLAPDAAPADPQPHADIALAAGAIGELRRARAEEVASLLSLAQRGLPPAVPPSEPRTVRFVTEAGPVSLEVLATGPRLYRVTRGGHRMRLRYRATGRNTALLTRGEARWRVVEIATPTAVSVEVEGVAHRLERASEGRIVAPVPAAVTEVCVREGDRVEVGTRLVTLEVMKMELAVTAPVAGRVERLLVTAASRVVAGQPIALLNTSARESLTPFALPEPEAITGDIPPAEDILRGAMLGYDLSPDEIDEALRAVQAGEAPVSCDQLRTLLAAFADTESLFEAHPGEDGVAPADHLARHLRWRTVDGLPPGFVRDLLAALAWHRLEGLGPSPAHDDALARILQAHGARTLRQRIVRQCLTAALRTELPQGPAPEREALRSDLQRFAGLVVETDRSLAEAAYTALYLLCDRPRQREETNGLRKAAARAFLALVDPTLDPTQHARLRAELEHFSQGALLSLLGRVVGPHEESTLLELLVHRLYPTAECLSGVSLGPTRIRCTATPGGILALLSSAERLPAVIARCEPDLHAVQTVEVFIPEPDASDLAALEQRLPAVLDALDGRVTRVSVNWGSVEEGRLSRTYLRPDPTCPFREEVFLRDLHPTRVEVAELDRLKDFDLERLDAPGELLLVRAQARTDPSDRRLVCVVEVERVDPVRDPETGVLLGVPSFERGFLMAMYALRAALERPQPSPRPYWNMVVAYVRPILTIAADEMDVITRRLSTATAGLGLEKMVLRCRIPSRSLPDGRPMQLVWTNPTGHGATLLASPPDESPVAVLTAEERRVMEARRRSLLDPYELVRSLSKDNDTGPLPRGQFVELDLGPDGVTLVPVARPFGQHRANLVVGKITNYYGPFPDGITRVLLVGDPTRGMGSLAEAECRRVIAALDLAEREGLMVEWVAVSSGARIAMDSGTENLDWTARALGRLVAFTQAGGTVNVLVDNVNVGAQSYWNAEATMLQHCRGTLVMTPAGSMLLTGKRALEYAGSVAAQDNAGIGGYARVMGPNGQAQYFARDLSRAYALLLQHMTFTAVLPGEGRPRRLASRDPLDRDITTAWYDAEDGAEGFRSVGEIFDEATNPGRKRPFAIRPVMRAVLDADIAPLERWAGWQGAEGAVVWEGSLGGDPVCCIGIESRPLPRRGEAPADGPAQWTSGTLFPQSSKKVARALNAASGVRPVVLLANLSGFDGSPDSLRHLQLEYGAEIGRAVVNFRGPLVFCVVGRYHGGAYVVFSRALNPGIRAVALEGAYASVIGGGPAAAVVFPGMVRKRAESDPAVLAARAVLESAPRSQRGAASTEYARVLREAEAQAQAAVAREFDAVHSVDRALAVGSLEAILAPRNLRPALIERIRAAPSR